VLALASSAAEYAVGAGGLGFFGLLYTLRRDPRFEGVVDARTVQLFVGWFVPED
jgi:hypothetical protein